jgi:hypothetical protein
MPKFGGGSGTKVPLFLSDLYYDLRDRRLLPLVALILVAIVAAPILLSSNEEKPERAAVPPPAPAPSSPAGHTSLTVVEAHPGLRNPDKRLAHRKAKNPFKQRFTGPVLKGSHLQAQTSTTSSSATVTETETSPTTEKTVITPSGGGGAGSDGSGNGSNGAAVPAGGTTYTLAVTLQITRIETKPDGSVDKKGPTPYKDVRAPAPLPGEKTPVITYLGMGSKDRVPMFLVSNEVTAIYGETNCIAGASTCQLLVLEEGFPVTFVYGDNDVRYKINLLKATPVIDGHT